MKRKSAQFGFATPLIIAIVGAVIIILAVVSYLLFFSKTTSQPVASPQPTQTPARETSGFTPSQTDETANWETYTNEEYGFEVKYPQNFFALNPLVTVPVDEETKIIYKVNFAEDKYQDQLGDYPYINIKIITTALSPQDWFNKYSTERIFDSSAPKEPVNYFYYGVEYKGAKKVGGLQGIQFTAKGINFKATHTLLKGKDNILFDISNISSERDEVISDNIYNQILSTFRFE